MLNALLIRDEWLEKILAGTKTWEIRGSNTTKRGLIALVRSGSGLVVGACNLVESRGPLTVEEFNRSRRKVGNSREFDELPYPRTHAWVLGDALELATPVSYDHPSGAVIWVKLTPAVEKKVREQLPEELLGS